MKTPAPFGRIVARFGHLKQLTAQAARLDQLDALVKAGLPPSLQHHTRLAAIRDGCLVLHVDSAAWATQLRYRTPEILAQLPAEPEFDDVRSIRIRTRPVQGSDFVPADPARPLSQASVTALRAQADCTGDERLREALLRLARRGP